MHAAGGDSCCSIAGIDRKHLGGGHCRRGLTTAVGAGAEQVFQEAMQSQSGVAPTAMVVRWSHRLIAMRQSHDRRAAVHEDDPFEWSAISAGWILQPFRYSILVGGPNRRQFLDRKDGRSDPAAKCWPGANAPPARRSHRIATGPKVQPHGSGPAPFRMPYCREDRRRTARVRLTLGRVRGAGDSRRRPSHKYSPQAHADRLQETMASATGR